MLMDKHLNRIIIDAGNTQVKVAAFDSGQISEVVKFKKDEHRAFQLYLDAHQDWPKFMSSVRDAQTDLNWLQHHEVKMLDADSKVPIKISYQTPESLGKDRLANAVAGYSEAKGRNILVIDLGTCVKFDVVDASGHYLGGSIAPGLSMRYAALNHFTGKLPLLQAERPNDFVGRNTTESLHVGVVESMTGELEYLMNKYNERFSDLAIFVTGGDAHFFDFLWKSNIFALENLTLQGLYYIAELND